MALEVFRKHPRIRVVNIDEGFKGNASFFKYARDLGNRRGDMYEIGLWEDSIVESGNDIMYAINIPQESVTIPETMDAIRAAIEDAAYPRRGHCRDEQVSGHRQIQEVKSVNAQGKRSFQMARECFPRVAFWQDGRK